jgi:hypothetical protein
MKSFLVILIFCTLFPPHCTKPFCGESVGLEASSIGIELFDQANKEYFYLETGQSLYNKDSLRVFDENGQKFGSISFVLTEDPRNKLRRFYKTIIFPAFRLPGDEDALNTEKTRTMYLRYSSIASDTLTLAFKAKKNRCDRYIYEYVKVYRGGNLIVPSIANDILISFQLNH